MSKKSDDFLKVLLKDKKLKLEHLHEEHRIDIALYNAKRKMIMSDIDLLENQVDDSK